jgi:hypothetical protein
MILDTGYLILDEDTTRTYTSNEAPPPRPVSSHSGRRANGRVDEGNISVLARPGPVQAREAK